MRFYSLRKAPPNHLPGALTNVSSLIPLNGRRMHVRKFDGGSSRPTVVFESALGCPCTEWEHIQRSLMSSGITSLSYDRPGIGWSERRSRPDSAEQHALQLDNLLTHFGANQVVLVGHSVGGLLIRSYVARYPTRISGIVLVDSSHPAQHIRSSRQREGLHAVRDRLKKSVRQKTTAASGKGAFSYLPVPLDQLTHEVATSRAGTQSTLAEMKALLSSWEKDLSDDEKLGHLPMAVLTSEGSSLGDPAHAILQKELAELSTESDHYVIEEATHLGIVMEPRHATQVTETILEILSGSRKQ